MRNKHKEKIAKISLTTKIFALFFIFGFSAASGSGVAFSQDKAKITNEDPSSFKGISWSEKDVYSAGSDVPKAPATYILSDVPQAEQGSDNTKSDSSVQDSTNILDLKTKFKDESTATTAKETPFPAPPSITGNIAPPRDDQINRDQTQISVTNSRQPKRGVNVNSQVPSVRHVTMSPASRRFGGDDVEIVISPLLDVLVHMPDDIDYYKTSNTILTATPVPTNPSMIVLKLGPVQNQIPISLHLVDIRQQIYTFTVIATPADLAWEYPKTISVTRRISTKTEIGKKNPKSVIDAMDVDDAIQMVVGDVPNTNEYGIDFLSGRYMHYEGYAQYAFRVYRKDHAPFDIDESTGSPNVKFTIWANNRRLDGGAHYAGSREIEWTIEPILSRRETRRRGHETLRVFVQIKASILDLEEWESAFITVSDSRSYTRFDFPPLIREFRAPIKMENQ